MAVRTSSTMPFARPVHHRPSTYKTKRVMIIFAKAQPSSLPIHITSNHNYQKVFEDKSSGIVCYRDEKGDITCEGWDEGPRFSSHPPDPRDSESIVRLLKRSLLLVFQKVN